MKIAISAGHNVINSGIFDRGSSGNGKVEALMTKETVKILVPMLRSQGHEVRDITPYDNRFINSKQAHQERANRVRAFKADLYLDIHINAGGGTGPETIVYSTSSSAYKHARNITNSIANKTGLTNRRGVRVRPGYWSVSMQPQPSIIVEGAFIDSAKDMQVLTPKVYAEAIAECFGTIPKPKPKTLYKVQLGAYSIRENADRLLNELKEKGFNGFIRLPEKDNLYRVQTGAYSIRSNADKLLDELDKKGFKGFIVVEETEKYPIPSDKKSVGFQIGDAKIIKTTPENIYIPVLGDNLFRKGFYGVNGTFFDTTLGSVSSPNACIYIAVNNGKALSGNSQFNGWKAPPRGTIHYSKSGNLGNRRVKSINELPKDIVWAIGGVTIKPYMQLKDENIPTSISYKTSHTYLGYDEKGYIYLIVKPNHRPSEIVPTLDNLGIKQCIMLDGGGSSQLNYSNLKHYSNRKINTAVLLKRE